LVGFVANPRIASDEDAIVPQAVDWLTTIVARILPMPKRHQLLEQTAMYWPGVTSCREAVEFAAAKVDEQAL